MRVFDLFWGAWIGQCLKASLIAPLSREACSYLALPLEQTQTPAKKTIQDGKVKNEDLGTGQDLLHIKPRRMTNPRGFIEWKG